MSGRDGSADAAVGVAGSAEAVGEAGVAGSAEGPAGEAEPDAAVGEAAEQSGYRRIVVGVDGSPVSRHALAWAAREAELRGCQLDVVYGWQVSTEPRPPGVGLGVAPPLEAYQRQAAEKLERIVRETLGPEPSLRYAVHAVHRAPGRALVEESEDADLLVLGTKGHGRLAAWLLGSIADEAMNRAPCSVVIVRPPPEPPAEG
jgi:nucleotide-binding universal stress UspA family protein